jgi:hypothetical protein
MGKGGSLGKEAVLANSGRAGEKSDVFNILLGWEERAPTEDNIGTAEILAGL